MSEQQQPRKRLSVLLVDDDPDLRRMFDRYLSALGVDVYTAGSAAEARMLCVWAHELHVLVVDVGLPDGNGLDLAAELELVRPGMAVLAISGAPEDRPSGRAFLQKPFSPDQLRRAVTALGG